MGGGESACDRDDRPAIALSEIEPTAAYARTGKISLSVPKIIEVNLAVS